MLRRKATGSLAVELSSVQTIDVQTMADFMANENSRSKPSVRPPNTDGLPHSRRDASDTDAGAKPLTPKTAGTSQPSSVPLDNPVANRNAGRPRQTSTTPRPTDKPLD
jgi:hypothetical protein